MSLLKNFEEGKKGFGYKTKDDEKRIKNYTRYHQIMIGNHEKVFNPDLEDEVEYLSANFAGLISRINADFLFGEPAKFDITTENDNVREELNKIVKNNHLHTENWEAAYSVSAWGDILIKNRRDKDGNAIIEYVRPTIYYPILDEDNINKLEAIILAWKKTYNNEDYLRIEIHKKGEIINQLWRLEGAECKYQVDLGKIYKDQDIPEREETGLEGLAVNHIPNFSFIGRHFGISDYKDLLPLFKAINNRLTRTEDALNKHADPKMAVPQGVLNEKGEVKVGNLQMFEVTGGSDTGLEKPEYIVWDANLKAAFKHCDKLVDLVLQLSETSKAALGEDKGGKKESGRALKFKLIRTLSKITRKRRYFGRGLQKALENALQLKGISKEEAEVSISWNDGIPTDKRERAEINDILVSDGQMSVEQAVRERMSDASEEEIQAELDRLKEKERQMTVPAGEGTKEEGLTEKEMEAEL